MSDGKVNIVDVSPSAHSCADVEFYARLKNLAENRLDYRLHSLDLSSPTPSTLSQELENGTVF
ncbi:MAG: hypothetical protein L0Y73_09765, partial [Candidatus Aminicenantes bacterium]|nr:hypothetical protein [Candidatus Aminicenantes bacterium]